jgi:hypothetical protein
MADMSGTLLLLLRSSVRICAPAQLQTERGCGVTIVIYMRNVDSFGSDVEDVGASVTSSFVMNRQRELT